MSSHESSLYPIKHKQTTCTHLFFFHSLSLSLSRPRLDLFAFRLSTEWQSRFLLSLWTIQPHYRAYYSPHNLNSFDVCVGKRLQKKKKLRLCVYVIIVVKFLQRSMKNKSCWVSVCSAPFLKSILFFCTALSSSQFLSIRFVIPDWFSVPFTFFTLFQISLFSNRQTRTCEKIMNKKCAACFFFVTA